MIDSGRLQAALMRWAKTVAPASGRAWIEAMESESKGIQDRKAALSWSFGSLVTALRWAVAANWGYFAALFAVAFGTPNLANSAFMLAGRSGLADPILIASTPFAVGVVLAGLVGAYRPDRVLASTLILLLANFPGITAMIQYLASLVFAEKIGAQGPSWLIGAVLILLPSLVGPLLGATVRHRVGRA